jgi:uncharacterized protein (TIGR00299 family) protein
MTALWINPAVGVAGDMLLAALIDAGADPDAVRSSLASLAVHGWSLEVAPISRRGLTATSVVVGAPDGDHHRSWSTIDRMLADAALPGPVRDGARATFEVLARAEARVHGIDPDDVHFHEVGAVDAIVDVVGTWAALHDLGDPAVTAAPVGLGVGTTAMAHGTVPVPAPATLELLEGHPTAPVVVDGRPVEHETATPTGVALLVTMATAWGPLPAGTIRGVGRGAGSWDPPGHANVVTVVRYDPAEEPDPPSWPATTVGATIVETNVDDVTPEVLGHVISRALELGADDAWVLPVTMKKSRPGHQVRVLCRPELAPAVRHLLASETGSLGLREWPVTKHELERTTTTVLVDGRTVAVKVGPFGAKPEHDDVVAAARALDRPARDVAEEALRRHRAGG